MVAHAYYPKKAPAPTALRLYNWLGENRLLVAGGVYDQPAGDWIAAQRAGYIASLISQEQQATKEFPIDKRVDAAGNLMLINEIKPLRMKLAKELGGDE